MYLNDCLFGVDGFFECVHRGVGWLSLLVSRLVDVTHNEMTSAKMLILDQLLAIAHLMFGQFLEQFAAASQSDVIATVLRHLANKNEITMTVKIIF